MLMTHGFECRTWHTEMLCHAAQVHVADPDVWGSCVATDMYRQYSSICNHQTQDACKKDPAGCIYLTEYDTEVCYHWFIQER
jgi:hypothetical protein